MNAIAVVEASSSRWKRIPPRIHQWGPEEMPDYWTRTAVHGFLTGADETSFGLLWRYWMKDEAPEELAGWLARDRADAVILLAPREEHRALIPALAARELPVVLAFARSEAPGAIWAACDNRGGVASAVAHLVKAGHRRIAFAAGRPGVADFAERKEGYLQGLSEANLEFDPSLVIELGSQESLRDMRAHVAALLRRPDRPTAIVCCTDVMALSVLEVAWEMGLTPPQDLAVVGFDDSEEAALATPPLTTVRQPVAQVAGVACYLAACAVEGQEPETGGWQVELPVELVVRESCGASLRSAQAAARTSGSGELAAVRRELEWHMRQLQAINEELQELLYVASHDLRAPLITIQGFTSALERKYASVLDDRGRDYLRRVQRSVAHMGELMDSLLALSRSQSQPLNLRLIPAMEVVKRALHDLELPLRERNITVRLPHRMPLVMADELGLYQIFLNLIGNAVKYVADAPEPLIHIGCRRRGDEYEFWVRDNGIGIPPEHHHEIFQAFRRLGENQVPGTGIGLTIVRRMVLRHGGRIWVESAPGAGATFRFTLPRREKQQ